MKLLLTITAVAEGPTGLAAALAIIPRYLRLYYWHFTLQIRAQSNRQTCRAALVLYCQ